MKSCLGSPGASLFLQLGRKGNRAELLSEQGLTRTSSASEYSVTDQSILWQTRIKLIYHIRVALCLPIWKIGLKAEHLGDRD